jgi:stage III sporulation protein AG
MKLLELAKKYRYVLVVLAVGIILMMLPTGEEAPAVTEPAQAATPDLAVELEQILCKISGAGRVEVMLTSAAGQETIYERDIRSEDQDTVIITDENRREQGLIKQIISPTYQGAIIVCEGADSPTVRLAILEAVTKVTGLGADRVCVLKMK